MDIDEDGAFQNPKLIGGTVGVGYALNSTVVGGGEFHMKAGVTETIFKWNLFEWYEENIYENVMAW